MNHLDDGRLTRLLAVSLLLTELRTAVNKAARKHSRKATQHVCQHTHEGSKACQPCRTMGPLPQITHITTVGAGHRGASHFSRFWNSVSAIRLASTVSEDTASAITWGVSNV